MKDLLVVGGRSISSGIELVSHLDSDLRGVLRLLVGLNEDVAFL